MSLNSSVGYWLQGKAMKAILFSLQLPVENSPNQVALENSLQLAVENSPNQVAVENSPKQVAVENSPNQIN